MTIYFTSDQHFFHESVIHFSNRPFCNVEEMNEKLIESWNKTVNKNDRVYLLGDVSFGKRDQTLEVMRKLKGIIVLIKGNHDYEKVSKDMLKNGLISEYKVAEYIKYNKKQLWLTHIPLDIEGNRGAMWNVSGHIHDRSSRSVKQINVGVDSPLYNEFPHKEFGEPFSINEIDKVIENRKVIK